MRMTITHCSHVVTLTSPGMRRAARRTPCTSICVVQDKLLKKEGDRDSLHRLLVQLLTRMSYIVDLFDISTAHLPASEQQVGRMAMREVAYVILDQGALSSGIHNRTITTVRVFEAP